MKGSKMQKLKYYGLPYMGSKNRIAEWLVSQLPSAAHFVDLFCGGCAVTHRAILENRWDDYLINDINLMMPRAFLDAANGKFLCQFRFLKNGRIYKRS